MAGRCEEGAVPLLLGRAVVEASARGVAGILARGVTSEAARGVVSPCSSFLARGVLFTVVESAALAAPFCAASGAGVLALVAAGAAAGLRRRGAGFFSFSSLPVVALSGFELARLRLFVAVAGSFSGRDSDVLFMKKTPFYRICAPRMAAEISSQP